MGEGGNSKVISSNTQDKESGYQIKKSKSCKYNRKISVGGIQNNSGKPGTQKAGKKTIGGENKAENSAEIFKAETFGDQGS